MLVTSNIVVEILKRIRSKLSTIWYETRKMRMMDAAAAAAAASPLLPKTTTTNMCYLKNGIVSCGLFRNKWSEKKNGFYSGQYHYDWNCCVCSRHLLKYGTTSKHWFYTCIPLQLLYYLFFLSSSHVFCVP